ncbi:MAG TPA: amino acid ABC transporter permease [bacterium]|nr:amino acid ABC transporter permease [bacterium]
MVAVAPYVGLLVRGAMITLEVSALALALSLVIGVVVGMVATSRFRLPQAAARVYVELVRSVPLLVQLFFVYYGLPLMFRVNFSPYQAATAALSLYGGAYMVEAVRSGIQSVGRNQWEAARALGVGYWRTMAHVVAPQAIRVTLPAAVGIFISLLKGSSVASIIGFVELLQTAVNIRNSIFSLSPLLVAGILYFLMCYGLSRFGGRVERRFRYGAVEAGRG